jgi:hypothetical protein
MTMISNPAQLNGDGRTFKEVNYIDALEMIDPTRNNISYK